MSQSIRVVFAGTPDFAVPSLEALCAEVRIEVCGVISRPDKPRGRKRVLEPTPVKARALAMGLEVYQPPKLRDPAVAEWLRERDPTAMVVVAYGGMIPPEILTLPEFGCLNLHPSLLPKYRGAGPIQWSLMNGDTETGVTTMHLAEGWDDGDMILQERVAIEPDADAGDLHGQLSQLGAAMMTRTVLDVADGTAPRTPQDEKQVTWAPKIEPVHEAIDWSQSAKTIHNQIRALSPSPGAHTTVSGKRLKLYRSALIDTSTESQPGSVLDTSYGTIRVAAGQGGLELLEVQLDGKKRVRASDFLRGHPLTAGILLGS